MQIIAQTRPALKSPTIDLPEMWHYSYLPRVFLSLAVVSVAAPSPGSFTIPLHKAQLYPRGDDDSNTTQNLINFILDVNATLIKYDESQALQPIPGLVSAASTVVDSGSATSVGGTSNLGVQRRWDIATPRAKQKRQDFAVAHLQEVGSLNLHVGSVNVGSNIPLRIGTVNVGGIGVDLPCVFDTGSGPIVAPGIQCGLEQGCVGNRKYAETGLDTGLDDVVHFISANNVHARRFIDTVRVAGLEAKGVVVQSIRSVPQFPVAHGNTVAVVGLAASSGLGSGMSLFEALVRDNSIATHCVAFFFGRRADGTEKNSEMTRGRWNEAHYQGPITTARTPVHGLWALDLEDVHYGQGLEVLFPNFVPVRTTIDTGASLIFLPEHISRAVMDRVNGCTEARMPLIGLAPGAVWWLCPCDAKISVSFQFQGYGFEVDPRDMLGPPVSIGVLPMPGYFVPFELPGPELCPSWIVGYSQVNSFGDQAILGLPFLKNWYSIFNSDEGGSISFAKSRP